ACDPVRPERYKKDTQIDIPDCLKGVLRGERPGIGHFLQIDDTTIITALKRWSRLSKNPILSYLSQCLIERRLFNEIRVEDPNLQETREKIREMIAAALTLQWKKVVPALDPKDQQAPDYFILVDTCEFKASHRFENILFDAPESKPMTFSEIQKRPEHDIANS